MNRKLRFSVAVALWMLSDPARATDPLYDIGGASAAGAIKLICIVQTVDDVRYETNIALDRKTKSVTAYFPALKSGLKFVDGRIGDPQYGRFLHLSTQVSQSVRFSDAAVTVVTETPEGASVTLYDLSTLTMSTAGVATEPGSHKCRRAE